MKVNRNSFCPGTTKEVDPQTAQQWLASGQAVIVDVREPVEYQAQHIPGSISMPLSQWETLELPELADKKLIIHCKGGGRSKQACQKMMQHPESNQTQIVWNLTGGIEAWKAANLPTNQPVQKRWGLASDLMRQVQVAAGFMVFTFTVLGAWISPWFLLGSGFVGAGLMFAGLSGFCGLAMVLAKMPWNKISCQK